MSSDANITTEKNVSHLGTILGVWAHPDDETFSSAGIIAAATANGQNVICITATKGEAGVQDAKRWPTDKLGEIRVREMAAARQVLGLKEQHWLGYPDGGCAQVEASNAVAKIKDLINSYQPDTILTFGPDGMTGHPDHQTVSAWAHQAAADTDIVIYHAVQPRDIYEKYLKSADKQFNIFFNIDEPPLRNQATCDICFNLSGELFDKKYQALAAMPSQTEALLHSMSREQLMEAFGCECFEKATNHSLDTA